ncbi:response regulator [Mariprofundus sp. KV]|nr:response regulator [Mariprofundus sp. KV]
MKGIVQSFGGCIELVSGGPDKGACFSLLLPLIEGRTALIKSNVMQPVEGDGAWILLVDDREDVLETYTLILESLNYQVIAAAGGEKAIELFTLHRERIALLVTDVVMPKMSGPALAGELRRMKPELPVIFVSANSFADDQSLVVENSSFIRKPFSIEDISYQIATILNVA